MKLLLVQVPTSHLGAGEKVYPLGLSRLSALVPKTIEKKALDMNLCLDPWHELKQVLDIYTPDVVALSFRNLDPLAGHQTSYLPSLKTAARLVRIMVPQAKIIAGGPAFSLFANRLMTEIPHIDVGLLGEGETVFEMLLSPSIFPIKIPGVIWRNGENIVTNPMGPKLSLDEIPAPDTFLFNPNAYTKANTYVAAIGIEGKRGCDLRCGYCLYPFLGGRSMRLRNPEKIADEIQLFHKNYGIRLFHFTDSVVNRPKDHFEDVCNALIKRNLDIGWTGFFREAGLTPETLDLAIDSGLAAIYFSGDALTDTGLKLLNKRLTIKQILDAAKLTAQREILTVCHFLVNLPGETDESIKQSYDTLNKLLDIHGPAGNLGAVIFNHIRLYPGAAITRKLIQSGWLDPNTDFLYPVYHNPSKYSHILHEFEVYCHTAGVFSRLGISAGGEKGIS
ncbi:MAG: radical SAM protein [Proteobacteria bacterium]|nr:radical SAM protein [Pseudomonadota bacterium]MBU1583599.1 radical SAM protein [Pseudomonadota bacterium]MBU2452490.1 radical SAM protein [Pseudomonadota bacterium]MBU2629897.1 radical SAM protein [Pseudomonadota bacterium]